jgi:glycosyltransferase involved in cell wall biosynthesis
MLWDKGVSEFVAAAREVLAQRPTTRFVLVGGTDPNPESIPEHTLRGWQEAGLVQYWGWRSDVATVLRSADILCLPSYREGLPRSLLEGGASGLPLIATDVPGCRDAVRANVSGIIVPPRDPAALAAAMMQLIDDVDLRARMGAAARMDVIERFSESAIVRATKAVYAEALSRAL